MFGFLLIGIIVLWALIALVSMLDTSSQIAKFEAMPRVANSDLNQTITAGSTEATRTPSRVEDSLNGRGFEDFSDPYYHLTHTDEMGIDV